MTLNRWLRRAHQIVHAYLVSVGGLVLSLTRDDVDARQRRCLSMQREKATRATSMNTEVQAMHTVTKEGRTHVMFLDVETVPESERPLYAGHVETTKDSGGRTHVRFDDGATPAPEVEIQNQINGRSYVNFDSPGRLQPRHLASETKSCVNDGLHTTDPLSHCPFPDDGAPEDLESAQAWHRALDSV